MQRSRRCRRTRRGAHTMTRVLVVDDHTMMRDSVARLIDHADGCEVVGTAGDGRAAVDLADRLAPDVVLMDISPSRPVRACSCFRGPFPAARRVADALLRGRA